MKVKDVMCSDVQCCVPETNLAAAASLMWDRDCGVLPVVENGRLAGIVTDRDICIALGTMDRPAHELTVRDISTKKVETCEPTDDLLHAMEVMRRAKVRRLPVVDKEGKVYGIVSLNDIALRADRGSAKELSYEQVMNTVKAISEHRPQKQPVSGQKQPAFAVAS